VVAVVVVVVVVVVQKSRARHQTEGSMALSANWITYEELQSRSATALPSDRDSNSNTT
jgi:hypothetical protein